MITKTTTIREITEERERNTLSKFATLSCESDKRATPETPDEIRTCFAIDRDRIIHCNSFRRLKGKTQVFILPENDHYQTRMTHTLESAQIARTIAKALNLNEELAEAVMLLHDCSHVSFGHPGEEALNTCSPYGYEHEKALPRRVGYLEKRGQKRGLNLTHAVINGATNHSGLDNHPRAYTKEGNIAPFADKIAYLTSDMENAIKAGIITELPYSIRQELGDTKGQILDTVVKDLIYNSMDIPKIKLSEHIFECMMEFREFMYAKVYFSKRCRDEADKAIKIITDLYGYLLKHPESIPESYEDPDVHHRITDYISSMTDIYAVNLFKKFFML